MHVGALTEKKTTQKFFNKTPDVDSVPPTEPAGSSQVFTSQEPSPYSREQASETSSFVEQMKQTFIAGTHKTIAKLPFFRMLREKTLSPTVFLQYLTNQLATYQAFEKHADTYKDEAWFKGIYRNELQRSSSYKLDQKFIAKFFRLPIPSPSDEAKEYIDQLNEMVKENPKGLIALSFIRYGSLLIGRMLEGWVKNYLTEKLSDSPKNVMNGMNAFSFPKILKSRAEFRKDFRTAIENADITKSDKDFNITKAGQFFQLSHNMLVGLTRNLNSDSTNEPAPLSHLSELV